MSIFFHPGDSKVTMFNQEHICCLINFFLVNECIENYYQCLFPVYMSAYKRDTVGDKERE